MANGGGDPVILATAGYDHRIRFWQAHSGICHRTVQHPDSQVNALDITPDKQLIAAAGRCLAISDKDVKLGGSMYIVCPLARYQHIRMYDVNSNSPNAIINYEGVQKNITSVGFHEDGKWMYTGGEDHTAKIWDLRPRSLSCQRIFQVKAPVNCVTLHPNQEPHRRRMAEQLGNRNDWGELYVGDQSGSIHCWDLKTDHNEHLIPEPDAAITSVSIDPMGTLMAAVNNKGNCYLWTMNASRSNGPSNLHPKKKFQAHNKYILKCLFSPDSTLLATTSADGTCRIWRTADLSLCTELKDKSQRWVWDCAFSGDSQYIITASSDNNARLWSVNTGEIKREYSGHEKAVVCLAFRDEVVS